jgi:hypothetical protein
MLKKILTVVLPLALPILVYAVYQGLARRRARLAGEGVPPRWANAPWTLILTVGVVLMAASLVTYSATTSHDPGTLLSPPRVVDGEVVPSQPIDE